MIREYVPADEEAVKRYFVELQEVERKLDKRKKPGQEIAQEYFDHVLRETSNNSGKVVVAEEEGGVVGFAAIWLDSPKELTTFAKPTAYLSDVYVDTKFRRRGIAGELIETCLNHARSVGAQRLTLVTLAENLPIQELLRKYNIRPYVITWEADL